MKRAIIVDGGFYIVRGDDMELPKRKNIRLRGYDYSQNGAYFITICTKDRCELLWDTVGARIARPLMSNEGKIVENAINQISVCYPMVSVEKYVIMPNHIHMILMICTEENGRAMRAPTVSTIINQMKGHATKQIGFSIWQKLFHDHIIRNEEEYQKIWRYIDTNPQQWEQDCYWAGQP